MRKSWRPCSGRRRKNTDLLRLFRCRARPDGNRRGCSSAGPDGRQQVDIQGQGFVNIEIQIITEPVEGLHALQQFVHGHLGCQRSHLRMNRSDFRGSGGNQGCLAEPADQQFQCLIALFQIFRLYLGGVRVLIAGLPVGSVRSLGRFPGFIFQSLAQVLVMAALASAMTSMNLLRKARAARSLFKLRQVSSQCGRRAS